MDIKTIVLIVTTVLEAVVAVVRQFASSDVAKDADLARKMLSVLLSDIVDLYGLFSGNPNPTPEDMARWREKREKERRKLIEAIQGAEQT